MDEVVKAFLLESHENLLQVEQELMQLEDRPGDRELLATSEEAVQLLSEQEEAETRHERFQRAVVVREEIEKLKDQIVDEGKEELSDGEILFEKLKYPVLKKTAKTRAASTMTCGPCRGMKLP